MSHPATSFAQVPTMELPLVDRADKAADVQIYMDILGGQRIPDYEELTAVTAYVDGFTAIRSTAARDLPPIWQNTLPDGKQVSLTENEITDYRHVVNPTSWLLSAATRTQLEAVLAGTTAESQNADPFDLIAQQNDAERRIALDEAINAARAANVERLWRESRHAVRRGLGPLATEQEITGLEETGLRENMRYVRPAPLPSREDRAYAAELKAQQDAQAEEAARQAQEASRPSGWQRFRRAVSAFGKLSLEA